MIVTPPLADPAAGAPLARAAEWVGAVATGDVATAAATLAVAALGLLLLQGRLPLRRAARAALGCCLIFGAGPVGAGLLRVAAAAAEREAVADGSSAPPARLVAPAQPEEYDPYAGAAVPVR
ncbi:TrbC/VirB2 family protein [Sphingomonas sp. RHCKR7]|uniref:TrbC/VirB2 family protein n=1 Tax=Sphingomonas folli TaxID=2862497 RepID=UPI001CA5618C|nr:TrbC/VirB2 family protein [Sphingomonas folli]MBW6528695.1 TrbC/VirB2 family protein [Sphingomonas folli]